VSDFPLTVNLRFTPQTNMEAQKKKHLTISDQVPLMVEGIKPESLNWTGLIYSDTKKTPHKAGFKIKTNKRSALYD